MWAKSATLSAVSDSVEPTLLLQATISQYEETEVILGIVGSLSTTRDQKVGESVPGVVPVDPRYERTSRLVKANKGSTFRQDEIPFSFRFRLTSKEVARLESLRNENPKRNVTIKAEFRVTLLKPVPRAYPIIWVPLNQPAARAAPRNVIGQATPEEAMLGPHDQMLIASDEASFVTAGYEICKTQVDIPASDWAHDFAPRLGLGTFLLYELPTPAKVLGEGPIYERLRRALESLQEMKDDLRDGEWNDLVEHSRDVWDLFRDKEEDLTRAALVSDGLSQESADALISSIKEMFTFATKFLKPIEAKGRGLNPPLKAEKEEAYLVLATAVSVTNLISEKLRKSGTQRHPTDPQS